MERIKTNKAALALFIATIALVITSIIGFIIAFASMDTVIAQAREEGLSKGYDEATIDLAINMAKTTIYVAVVIAIILIVFQTLCGLKCSMQGKWRIGAIVFGVLLVLDYLWSITQKNSATWMNSINLVISIVYLFSAIWCKPDEVKEEKTIEVVENNDNL